MENLSQKQRDRIVDRLNIIEKTMKQFAKSDDNIDTEVKLLMTAWLTCRTGRHNNKTKIIQEIEALVNSTEKYFDLIRLIDDLDDHADSWLRYKTKRPGEREDAGRPSWITLGRFKELGFTMMWPLVLALRVAEGNVETRFHGKRGNKISDDIIEMLLWSIIKGMISKTFHLVVKQH